MLIGKDQHLLVENVSGNPVWERAGTKTPTCTPRLNSRHQQWGRLFDHGYPSILIESGRRPGTGSDSHLQPLLGDSQLHPVRAGLVPTESSQGLMDTPWSGLVQAYAMAPEVRAP